jgi:hypothetical protein
MTRNFPPKLTQRHKGREDHKEEGDVFVRYLIVKPML